MIKGLKYFIFMLFVCCFIFFGYVKADGFVPIGQLGYIENNYDTNYSNAVLKKGKLLTQYLGTTKALFGLDSNTFVFWNNNKLYLYDKVNTSCNYYGDNGIHPLIQGYINKIRSCSLITITGDFSTNSCGSMIDYDDEIVSTFISSLDVGDWFYYNEYLGWEGRCRGYWYFADFCFSNNSIGQTLCFSVTHEPEGSAGGHEPFYGLGESLGFNDGLTFGLINRSYLQDPPGYFNGGNINGGSSISDNVQMTGNLVYNTCTNGYVVSQLNNVYGGTSVCYAGSYDTGTIDSSFDPDIFYYNNLGLTFKELYNLTNDGMSWNTWFQSYSNEIYRMNTQVLPANPFSGRPVALYSYFKKLYDNGNVYPGNSEEGYGILNYCKLALFSDYNSDYNGNYFSEYCSNLNYDNGLSNVTTGEVGSVDNDDEEVLPPGYDVGNGNNGSGVVVSVDWNGTLSGDSNKNYDGKTFINDFYQKLQSNYLKPYNGIVGIIPTYIIVFMLALILFRFLQH